MNILLINHYAGSPTHGMEYRPYYFAREWTRLGHDVTVVAASRSHLRVINPECRGISKCEVIDGVRYVWLWTPRYAGNGIARVVNIGVFVLQLLLHRGFLAKACKDGAVIASSTYPLDVVAAGAIAKRASASFTYEVHDLWPLSPIELGGMSPRHPFIRVMQWAEDSAYHRVNHVISMLPSAESHMLAHGLASGKFHYVPNGIDPTEWGHSAAALPEPHLSVLSRLRSEKKFIIGYAGAHGVANALEIIVRAAGLLVDSQVTFVLVGQGPEKHNLQALATKLGIENVVFLLPVPKAAIPSLLSVMDGLIIASKCTSLYRFGVSQNKLMDYMMAGRPIIQAMDASNDLVSESGCGFSVPPDDPATIAKAVLQMMNLTIAERNEMGRCGRRYVEANHDCHKLATLFLDIICGGKTGPSVDYQAAPYPSR